MCQKKKQWKETEEFTFGSMSTALCLLLLYQQSRSIKSGHMRGEDVKIRETEQGSSKHVRYSEIQIGNKRMCL